MSGNFYDANYNVTKIRTNNGDIAELELNNKKVALAGKIEAEKEVTIKVSEYTKPVEITPTAGKDSMAKATVTLSNIPSGGGDVTFYKWCGSIDAYTMSEHPNVGDYVYEVGYSIGSIMSENKYIILAVGEGTITITYNDNDEILDRDSSENDLHFVKSST
jgi:hypothetical protein